MVSQRQRQFRDQGVAFVPPEAAADASSSDSGAQTRNDLVPLLADQVVELGDVVVGPGTKFLESEDSVELVPSNRDRTG